MAHQARVAGERRAYAAVPQVVDATRPTGCASLRSWDLPLIVKPAREGSTIGITKVTPCGSRRNAARSCVRRSLTPRPARAGRGVRCRCAELTAAIVNGRALPLIRIEAPQGNYDYHSKYFSDETKYFLSGRPARRQGSRRFARRHSTAFDCRRVHGLGASRPDPARRMARSRSSKSTHRPGMTGHSLVPMAARQATGMSFSALCMEILRGAHVG